MRATLFALGMCFHQLSLAEEHSGALYQPIAILSTKGMERTVVHVSKLPDDGDREQSVGRDRQEPDVNAESLALATMVGCTAGSECTNYRDCTPGAYCTSEQCTSGECTGAGGCTSDVQCTKNTDCTSGSDCTYGQRCTWDPNCTAGANCTVGGVDGNCTRGRGCTAGWRCTAGEGCTKSIRCTIGAGCTSHNGCTSGRDPHDPRHFCTSGPHCPKPGPVPAPPVPPAPPIVLGRLATPWQLLLGYSMMLLFSITGLRRQL